VQATVQGGDTDHWLVERSGVYLYNALNAAILDDWWVTTHWEMRVALDESEYPKQKLGSEGRLIGPWSLVKEGAYQRHGEPVVLCLLCDSVLAHPSNKSSASGNLSRRLRTSKCQRSATTQRHLLSVFAP
jgi:hypothetical protein